VHEEWKSQSSIVDSVLEQSSIVDSVLEQSSMILQPILHTSYWGSLWGQTCCSVIDAKLQLKHACASKKVTKKSYKCNKI